MCVSIPAIDWNVAMFEHTMAFGTGDEFGTEHYDDLMKAVDTLGVDHPEWSCFDEESGEIYINRDAPIDSASFRDSYHLTLDDEVSLPISDTHDAMVAVVLSMRANYLIARDAEDPEDVNWVIAPVDRSKVAPWMLEDEGYQEEMKYQQGPLFDKAALAYEEVYGEKPL